LKLGFIGHHITDQITSIWALFTFFLQRSRFENQIKQHNAKRATMAKGSKSTEGEGDEDDYSYEVALDEDFLASLFIRIQNATSF
jgi:hypothetical protein